MAENRMELFIETLTGTAFELSCSPLETIVSIKAKIQYSEGIPVSQQHLIWKSQELNDDLCLQDYSINDGATLKLVLGMRGGPINTRQGIIKEYQTVLSFVRLFVQHCVEICVYPSHFSDSYNLVSDTKKLKDLADYVERSSETAGSGGRPFTVLVFHDGDKVHMYTLMERGECTVSPLSGTISETSSVASIKNIEELDQEISKENETTREKIAQLQEQLRALNMNRPKRIMTNSVHTNNVSVQSKPATEKHREDFHLPPIQRTGAFNSPSTPYLHKNAQAKIRIGQKTGTSHFSPDASSALSQSYKEDSKQPSEMGAKAQQSITSGTRSDRKASVPLDYVSSSISTYVLSSPDKDTTDGASRSCSNFLPYIASTQSSSMVQRDPFTCVPAQNTQVIAVKVSTPCLDSIIKYDPSRTKKAHKQLPFTSNHALSSRRFIDLDEWLQARPKTSPARTSNAGEKSFKNKSVQEDKGKRRTKHSIKNPVPMSLPSGEKSSLMMQMFEDTQDALLNLSPPIVSKNKSISSHSQTKAALGSLVSSSIKALKPYCLNDTERKEDSDISIIKNTKPTSKPSEELSRLQSGKRLPLIKTKKKTYKRCSLCSKKTGLATSYTCRCGKNFCASHRYAEVHHCSYDYKTEGRRLLQLNNPVVTASKLPKI